MQVTSGRKCHYAAQAVLPADGNPYCAVCTCKLRLENRLTVLDNSGEQGYTKLTVLAFSGEQRYTKLTVFDNSGEQSHTKLTVLDNSGEQG